MPLTHPAPAFWIGRCRRQAFKIAISVDANHAESYANLGVLELRKGHVRRDHSPRSFAEIIWHHRRGCAQVEAARSNFYTAQSLAPHMFEPFFNGALLAFKLGDFQDAYELAQKALKAFPEHHDTHELLKQLKQHFTML